MVSRQLDTLASPPKELGLLSNLIGQILPAKQDQNKVLDNSTKSTRVQKKATYNKSRMTAQNLLGHNSRPLDWLLHFLLRHVQRDQLNIASSRRALRPDLSLLI